MATPQEYRGSSDRHYRRGKDLKWQDVERLLSVLGRSRREAIRGYCPLMLEELKEPYEKVESWGQAAKGDEAFAERILRGAGEPRILRPGLKVERVAREVARRLGLGLPEMSSQGRGRASQAHALTAWAGREAGNVSIASAAKHFDRDTATMARNVARLEARIHREKGCEDSAVNSWSRSERSK